MASKFCSKCGREVLAGKRFCGGCGQAMPMAVALPPDEAAAATHVCGQCGTALVPGKRFCKKCGHAVDDLATAAGSTQVSESAVVAETAPVAASVVPVCGRCGAALTPGKRFCKLCGQPAGVPAASTTFDLPGSAPVPAELPKAAIDPAPTPDHAPTITMEIAVPDPEPIAEENPQASKIEEVEEAEEAVPLPATSSAEISEAAPVAVPRDLSKAKIGLAIGFAATVLAAAGGGWAWYVHAHRPVSSAAGSAAPAKQSAAPLPAQEQTQATTTQAAKPPAGSSEPAVAEAPRTAPQSALKSSQNTTPIVQPQRFGPTGHGNPAAPTPVFQKPPVSPQAPLLPSPGQARSGVLHYQGPPVPHGGTVAFDKLPKARLKFTFDRTAWQLLIKPNPDGTKRVILISLAQGYQSNCDLGWEIVE